MKNSCDCIIPFYNEELRPLNVVETVLQIKTLSKIIVVDDGSIDQTTFLTLKKNFPQIKVIRLEKNSGKANAVKEGLKYVTTPFVLLLDGDLMNIKTEELENIILKITTNPKIDMIILEIKGDNLLIDSLFRKYIFQGGNRIIKKSDLLEIFKQKLKGYQLEVAINKYMIKNHKKIYYIKCSALNPHKIYKLSFLTGWFKDLQMDLSIVSYLGLIDYLKQMLFFCRKEIKIVR